MNTARFLAASGLALSLPLGACAPAVQGEVASAPASTPATTPETQGIGQLFEQYDAAQLAMSPEGKAYRGIRDADYGKWGDASDAAEERDIALLRTTLAQMRANYDPATLDEQDALSFRLFEQVAARREALWPYRDYEYIFDQMNGAQSQLPAFLINIHRVSDRQHAVDYVSRIRGLGPQLDTLVAESRTRAAKGVMPPDWVYPYVISDIQNLLNAGADNAVLEDFGGKVDALTLADADKAQLKADALAAWNGSAVPAYQRLLAEMQRQQKIAPTDDGIWRLPQGAAYYDALLANYTTTDLTADQVHRDLLAGKPLHLVDVREREDFYASHGIRSVPAVIINDRHLISGGQPAAVFAQALRQIASEAA